MRFSLARLRAFALVITIAGVATAPARAACDWILFPTADPYPSGNQLAGIAGSSATDVWEAGASYRTHDARGYVVHWNGARWSVFNASPASHGTILSGVAEAAPNDVWAVGQRFTAPNYGAPQALIERGTARAFAPVSAPAVAGQSTFLYGVTAFGADDVWAVGGAVPASGGLQTGYVVHWNGTAWTLVPNANVPNEATNLDAVAGTASTDLWVVGGSRATQTGPFRTLAEHWDGSAWTIVPTPNVGTHSNVFNAVVAVAPDDVWAIGDRSNGKIFVPLAEHWDGTAWRVAEVPATGSGTVLLYGAAAAATDDVFAAGEIARGKTVQSFVMRWNGSHWRVTSTPNVPNVPVTLLNAVRVLPDHTVWAVGGTANAKVVLKTVTEVHPCQGKGDAGRR